MIARFYAAGNPVMDRRTVILVVSGSLLAMPFASSAQTRAKVWRVGMLETTSETLNAANLDAFRQRLREVGYVEGSAFCNVGHRSFAISRWIPQFEEDSNWKRDS